MKDYDLELKRLELEKKRVEATEKFIDTASDEAIMLAYEEGLL